MPVTLIPPFYVFMEFGLENSTRSCFDLTLEINLKKWGPTLRQSSGTILGTCKGSNHFTLPQQTCKLELKSCVARVCQAQGQAWKFGGSKVKELGSLHMLWFLLFTD